MKFTKLDLDEKEKRVAPRVGAWIEIEMWIKCPSGWVSLPVWERGLKYILSFALFCDMASLPVWERGLKSIGYVMSLNAVGRSPCGSVD